jgi:glutamate-ammonia-ligase adenylyltransferase
MSRPEASVEARLARWGFADVAGSRPLIALPPLDGVLDSDLLLESLGGCPDPDLALRGLQRLAQALGPAGSAELAESLEADEPLRSRLSGVLGASTALAEHLARHPDQWPDLAGARGGRRVAPAQVRADLLAAVGADPEAGEPVAGCVGHEAYDRLRIAHKRALLGIAARDLSGGCGLDETAEDLSDLAGATLEAALAVARAELPADAVPARLAVIAMGKCGGRELNYISDVDVVYVAAAPEGVDEAAALATATRLASGLQRACSAQTAEGSIWEVDAGLRPEGKSGALVRTLASHVGYYERWAKTWEFQALLKARPVAGDLDLGRAYVEALAPMVWQAATRPRFVEDVQAMRRRVEEHIPAREADRQLKLGAGGLRDVEFSVQLLQLVHGKSDVYLRSGSTLVALESLATWGYVGRDDAASMAAAYRFLRTLEHRIQLHRLRRTHLVPTDPDDLRRIGRSMGFRGDAGAELERAWRRHGREARRLHEKLFYRPLLNAVARLEPGEARLAPEAAQERLEALGYLDPAGALRHLEALTTGVSRRAAIQRTLLPVLLGWFAEHPDPDAGLLGFRKVSDALGSTHWYLALLRDAGAAAERLATLLASSRYVTDLLLRSPDAVAMLGDDAELAPRPRGALVAEALSAVRRQDDPKAAVAGVRAMRRRELFRVAAADVLGLLSVEAVGDAVSDITAAAVVGAAEAATRAVEAARGGPLPTRVAVLAMGRLGGRECGYGSDADVLFVHDPLAGAAEADAAQAALAVANELRRLLAEPSTDPPLEIDADLRPEGRQGPLVPSLAYCARYYAGRAAVWEQQALLRAEPLAGDPEVAAALLLLTDPLRHPAGGLDEAQVREIRRIKARVEAERMPRGADPSTHTKLGRGGLADVEWTVQLLQLLHSDTYPELRTTRTLDALEAATARGLVGSADAHVLGHAWRMASRVRNAIVLVRGRASDTLPSDVRELAGVARLVGYPAGQTGDLAEDYRRAARRARAVVEKVFYA